MSRIRSVHPGLWTDERFVCASPLARLLFIGIWNECDDQGLFEWSPLKLKMRLLAGDNCDAALLLEELEAAGSLMRYYVGGKMYGAVRNFSRFQRPKKPNSLYPEATGVAAFCGRGAELAADNEPSVPNQFPTDAEKSPQMEDGGGKREEEEAGGGSAQAREAASFPSDLIELTDQICRLAGVRHVDPGPISRNQDEVRRWRELGVDLETVVVPAIQQVVADATEPIRSLKYFDAAVRRAAVLSQNPKEGNLNGRSRRTDDEPRNPMVRAAAELAASGGNGFDDGGGQQQHAPLAATG